MEQAFNLVRQILRSSAFLAQSTDQQQQTLDQIIATGEISARDVYNLLQDEINNQSVNGNQLNSTNKYAYLENLPYDVFVNIIDQGQITGRDLIHLCNSSAKLRQICLKTRQSVDNQGKVYKSESQYVYRRIFNQMGIQIGPNDNPSEIYAKLLGSYQLWEYNKKQVLGPLPGNPAVMLPIAGEYTQNFEKVEGVNFVKQVVKTSSHTLVLDALGNVWGYGFNDDGQLGLGGPVRMRGNMVILNQVDVPTQVPNLSNIVQIAGIDTFSVGLDSNGGVWLCGLSSGFGLPWNGQGQAHINPTFTKLNIDAGYGKIVKISIGRFLVLINDRNEAFIIGDDYRLTQQNDVKYVNQKYRYDANGGINFMATVKTSNSIIYSWRARDDHPMTINNNNRPLRKVIPLYDSIILLYEDGTLFIMSSADDRKSGQLQVGNLKFIDVDAFTYLGYAVGENGILYRFRSRILLNIDRAFSFRMPQMPELGVLEQVPGIDNVARIAVSNNGELALLIRNPSI